MLEAVSAQHAAVGARKILGLACRCPARPPSLVTHSPVPSGTLHIRLSSACGLTPGATRPAGTRLPGGEPRQRAGHRAPAPRAPSPGLTAPASGARLPGASRPQRDGSLGRGDAEAEALLEIELDDVGVMAEIADRDVLVPTRSRKSPPRRLTTTAPSTPGDQTSGPPRIVRRWSSSSKPPCSLLSSTRS